MTAFTLAARAIISDYLAEYAMIDYEYWLLRFDARFKIKEARRRLLFVDADAHQRFDWLLASPPVLLAFISPTAEALYAESGFTRVRYKCRTRGVGFFTSACRALHRR